MPAPASGFRSGKNGRATINGVTLKITRWSTIPKSETIDITSSMSSPYADYTRGIVEVDWEFDFDYFVTSGPFNQASPGALITNLVLFVGPPADATFWLFASAFVESGTCTSIVRGKVSGTLRGKSCGIFTKPTF